MSDSLNTMFWKLIRFNECSGSSTVAYKFSDPDGVNSGKSGWSFGDCQFDLKNNAVAAMCLRDCGFSEREISGLVLQTIPLVRVLELEAKLRANKEIIDDYSTKQLSYCLNKALNFDTDFGIPVESPGGILAGADYVNQYGSQGNGAKAYYRALGRPVTAEDVLDFKLNHTVYGARCPKDCRRRYNNLIKLLAGEL